MDGESLAADFPESTRAVARAAGIDLDAEIRRIFGAGQSAWPELAVPPSAMAAYLVRHLPAERSLGAWLAGLNAADLYLACGCAHRTAEALLAFEQTVLSRVPAFVARLRVQPADVDEIQQRVRERLLCAPAGALPRIASYAGEGTLVSFVRVTAVRIALSLRRNADDQPKEVLDDAALQALAPDKDGELLLLRARYQAEFKAALRDAFASLSADQRNVLRLRFALGLTIEQAASALGTSRATLVRWQAAAEERVRAATLRALQQRLRIAPAELDSMLRLVRSQLQLSLAELLKQSAEP